MGFNSAFKGLITNPEITHYNLCHDSIVILIFDISLLKATYLISFRELIKGRYFA